MDATTTTLPPLKPSPSTTTPFPPTTCALDNNPPSIPCPTCQDLLYCSSACQSADSPIHRHVCASFNDSPPPKPSATSAKHVLAVLFPVDKPTPELVWVRVDGFNDEESGISFQEAQVGIFFNQDLTAEARHSERNRVRNRDTRSMLEIWQIPVLNSASLELALNECIQSLAGLSRGIGGDEGGKPFHPWRGPVLVLFMTRSTGFMVDPGAYRDCQLQDFRDAVDFVVDFGNEAHAKKIREALGMLGRDSVVEEKREEVVEDGKVVEVDVKEVQAEMEVKKSSAVERERERAKTPPPTSFVIEME